MERGSGRKTENALQPKHTQIIYLADSMYGDSQLVCITFICSTAVIVVVLVIFPLQLLVLVCCCCFCRRQQFYCDAPTISCASFISCCELKTISIGKRRCFVLLAECIVWIGVTQLSMVRGSKGFPQKVQQTPHSSVPTFIALFRWHPTFLRSIRPIWPSVQKCQNT